MLAIVTIGAYGWTAPKFFGALESAGVDVFCDVRRRRGVRGAEYAFVNSKRLQAELETRSIGYIHRVDLAPTPEIRTVQAQADVLSGDRKRDRSTLSSAFVSAYENQILHGFSVDSLRDGIGDAQTVCLFCVEREPSACHRSLVAKRFEAAGHPVAHLLP